MNPCEICDKLTDNDRYCSNDCKNIAASQGNYERAQALKQARDWAIEQHRIWWRRFCFPKPKGEENGIR